MLVRLATCSSIAYSTCILLHLCCTTAGNPSVSRTDLELFYGRRNNSATVNLGQECRRFPLWLGNMRDECTEHAQWKPQRPWWWLGDSKETVEALILGGNKNAMAECMEKEFLEFMKSWPDCDHKENNLNSLCSVAPIQADYHNHSQHCDLVVLEGAFSSQEAFSVQSLGYCVRKLFPPEHRFFEKRPYFGHIGNATNYVSSKHNCTYLAGFLQLYAPGVAAQVTNLARLGRDAGHWKEVQSSVPDPGTLGIRTTEHLSYGYPSKLGIHLDDGSTYTVLVSLSNPEDYQGGEFMVEFAEYKPEKLTALVFRSAVTNHAVNEVKGGKRETLTTELWESIDVPTGFSVPRPTQADVKEYIKKFATGEF